MKTAKLGTVSHGTLRSEDLLSSFISTLEGLLLVNGDTFCRPENFGDRDRLNNLIGEAQDVFASDGEQIDEGKEEEASELVNELADALGEFAPEYCYFGTLEGDGSDFGFWLSREWRERAEEDGVPIVSCGSELPEDFAKGLWFQVSDHGNLTLNLRTNGTDSEVWAIA